VTNVDDGHAFDVASLSDEGAPPIPMATVHPGARFGPPTGRFQVRGSVGPTSFLINAHAIKLDRPLPNLEMDPKTKGLVQLSEPQKAVGRALIRPFAEGKLRASYVAIARVTNYGKEAVRGHIASVDALFITHGLCPHPASGDALDRVASVLQRHPEYLQ